MNYESCYTTDYSNTKSIPKVYFLNVHAHKIISTATVSYVDVIIHLLA